MKVSGFTFIRNGTLLGYPYIESIRSILPIVDEFIVNIGPSEDDTLERVRRINDPKVKIIQSTWNESMHDRGYVYGQQKMIAHFNCTGDWAFYLEGDEVVHENDLQTIRDNMERYLLDPKVEAFAFNYFHFIGGADTIATGPHYYRTEARIIRNSIRSYHPDGLFFVVMDRNKKGRYPNAILLDVPIYHYGNARSVKSMQEKNERVAKYWNQKPAQFLGYRIDPRLIKKFSGTHPDIIQSWLNKESQPHYGPDPDYIPNRKDKRYRIEMKLEKLFKIDFGKKHYKKIY